MPPAAIARCHLASSSVWFAVVRSMNWLKRSCESVRVSPVGTTDEGRNCKTSEAGIRLGGEEVKFARNVRSPKNVYRMTSKCEDDRLLCTTEGVC